MVTTRYLLEVAMGVVVVLASWPILYPNVIEPIFEWCMLRKRRSATGVAQTSLGGPTFCALVPVYGPNELPILEELVAHWVTVMASSPQAGTVIVVNGDGCEGLAQSLRRPLQSTSQIKVLANPSGLSKADNLNFGLDYVGAEVVGIFDADARPSVDCIATALDSFSDGVAFVQGANLPLVRSEERLLDRLVLRDFAVKYGIRYATRYELYDAIYFTGSNGYWRTKVVNDLHFRPYAFVEDIEISLRAILNAAQGTYCKEAVCFEQGPPNWDSWARQRIRWACGWRQLAREYSSGVVTSDRLTARLRYYWLNALVVNSVMRPVAWVLVIGGLSVPSLRPASVFICVVWLVSFVGTSLIRSRKLRHVWLEGGYDLFGKFRRLDWLALPLYELALIAIAVRASFRQPQTWQVTRRRLGGDSYDLRMDRQTRSSGGDSVETRLRKRE